MYNCSSYLAELTVAGDDGYDGDDVYSHVQDREVSDVYRREVKRHHSVEHTPPVKGFNLCR